MSARQPNKQKIEITDLCDHARGVVAEKSDRLNSELSESRALQKQLAAMQSVAKFAAAEQEQTPPEYAVRLATALFSVHGPQRRSRFRMLPFEESFNSRLVPVVAGTRNLHSTSHEVHGCSDDFLINVRLDERSDGPGRVIVGELLQGEETPKPLAGTPVFVTCQEQVIASLTTNQLGEFCTEVERPGELAIELLVSNSDCISIPLSFNDESE